MKKQIIDTAEVIGLNGGAIGIALSNVNQVLTTISLLAAIGFTCYKWYKSYKNEGNNRPTES